jgi:hypothetical protein
VSRFRSAAITSTLLAAVVLGGCGGEDAPVAEVTAPTTTELVSPLADGRYFGYIRGLVGQGDSPVIEFDRADFLTGDEAYEAALADGAIAPGEPVSNDYYIRNTDRSVVRLSVGSQARVTVVSCPASCTEGAQGDLADFLASLVYPGEKTLADKYRGTSSQYWIVVSSGLVEQIDEQYVP